MKRDILDIDCNGHELRLNDRVRHGGAIRSLWGKESMGQLGDPGKLLLIDPDELLVRSRPTTATTIMGTWAEAHEVEFAWRPR
jgi:hypothetical protein